MDKYRDIVLNSGLDNIHASSSGFIKMQESFF